MTTNSPSSLSPEELVRYARQIGPGVLTAEGQQKLKSSAALISRAGGVGGPAALALVMAGVGRVIIAHSGRLDSPDLNRQVLAASGPRIPIQGAAGVGRQLLERGRRSAA